MAIFKKKDHDFSEQPDLCCSFCGNKLKRLIAGPGVYICNECVAICNEIVADSEANERLSSGPIGWTQDEGTAVCSFCQTVLPAGQMLMVPERGQLCPECLEATRSTLDAPGEINKELP